MTAQLVPTPNGPVAVVTDRTGSPTVVLLHGLGGDHEQALGLLPADTVCRRVAIDMRAHGDTEVVGPAETLTIDEFSRDAEAVIEHLGLKQPLVGVGVSMGAAITLALALRRPDIFAGCALVRPAPPGCEVFAVAGRVLAAHGPAGLDLFVASPEYQEIERASPVVAGSLRRQFDRKDAQRRAAVLESVPYCPPPARDQLQRLKIPVLIVAAPDDPVHTLDQAEYLASVIPGATMRIVPAKLATQGAHEIALRAAVESFAASFGKTPD